MTEYEELFSIAILAFRSMRDWGTEIKFDELPPNVKALDIFLAHTISEDLWEKIREAEKTFEFGKPPYTTQDEASSAAREDTRPAQGG